MEWSDSVPMAVNCSVSPLGRLELAGVTAIDTSVTLLIVSRVDPLIPLSVAEMVDVPADAPRASPAALIVATAVVAEAHVTWPVRFSVEWSEKVPVAVNCLGVPLAILGFAGVTAIDSRAGAVTVRIVDPLLPASVAVMVDVPVPSPVATPTCVIVETAVVPDAQVTWLVRSSVELSEKVPVAVNDSVSPLGTLGFAGVTAIDSSAAVATVRTVEPVIPSNVAEIVDEPVSTPVASPAAVMVATEVVADAHVTWLVRSSVELSENVPVATSDSVSPLGILGFAGVTTIERRTAGVTVSTVEPVIPFSVALILDVPVSTAVATPFEPAELEMVATLVVADDQVTWLLMSWVDPSPKVPVAVNCWVSPLGRVGLAGVSAIETSGDAVSVSTVDPVIPSNVAVMFDVPVATPVASPAALMVATEGVADAQVTWAVTSCVELSENVPVAVNC